MIIVGIDLGLCVKSYTGVAIIETSPRRIIHTCNLDTKQKSNHAKYHELSRKLVDVLNEYAPTSGALNVAFEYFVMRGKSGQSLQRLAGAYMAALQPQDNVIEIQNTSVKYSLTGKGTADKRAVADGVRQWFVYQGDEQVKVTSLKKRMQWDQIDALAIAISAWEEISPKTLTSKSITEG